MYIKHMKLVCTNEKLNIPGTAYLDLKPLRVLGPKEVFYRLLDYYKWYNGLYDPQNLFKMYQAVRISHGQIQEFPCLSCSKKVICLVSTHTDRNYEWPKEICPLFQGPAGTIPDKKLTGEKVKLNKLRFIMEHKCTLCAHRTSCQRHPMIKRILCKHYTKIEELHELAQDKIIQTWGSVNRFMTALQTGWKEVHWKPPEGKRRRRYRVFFVHPNQKIDLIKDYYPYTLREHPVHAYKVGLQIPEESETIYTKDDLLTSWILWDWVREVLINRRKMNFHGPGHTFICGHHNYLLSMYRDHSGHPMLVTSTSRWKYKTLFADFSDIGWNLEWAPISVMKHLVDSQ